MKLSSILSLSACLFAAVPLSHAVTISAAISLPISDFNDENNLPMTETTSAFGTFDFTGQNYLGVDAINSLSISLRFFNLDTAVGFIDRDNISLTLDGYDTGIFLNDYGNAFTTRSFNTPIANSNLILAALQSDGFLTIGMYDRTSSPSNVFGFSGGTATLTFNPPVVIPFNPSHAVGLIALAGVSYVVRRRKQASAALVSAAA